MISFGPEFAIELSADAAALPAQGGAAPVGADSDLFEAVLGHFIGAGAGDAGVNPEGDLEASADDGGDPEANRHEPPVIDPTQLVNPLFTVLPSQLVSASASSVFTGTDNGDQLVPGTRNGDPLVPGTDRRSLADAEAAPLVLPTHADGQLVSGTDRLALPGTDRQGLSGAEFEFESASARRIVPDTSMKAEIAEGTQLLMESGQTTIEPATAAAIELPIGRRVSGTTGRAIEGKAGGERLNADIPTAAELPQDVDGTSIAPQRNTPNATGEKSAAIVSELSKIANTPASASSNERITDSKPRASTRVDASVKAIPFQAVERAYADNDRDGASTFDSPKEPAQTFRPLTPIAPPPQPAAFVMPVDARPTSLAATPAPATTIGAPASMDAAVATYAPAQIVHSLRLQAINGGGEAVIRLRPEYLGEVVVAVKVDQGSVTAALQADTPAVRQWVERNEPMLRQALAEQGLQLERLTVAEKASETDSDHESDRQPSHDEPSPHQRQRRRRPQDDDATFEVTV